MSWYFRKSVGMGPFRMNFSKSGVSYSFGVKGARINTGRKGTYVSFGSNGIYYRKKINGWPSQQRYSTNTQPLPDLYTNTQPHTITSGPVEQITDVDSQDFVNELNKKSREISYLNWIGIPFTLLFIFCFFNYATTEVDKVVTSSYHVTVDPTYTDINIRDKPSEKGKVVGRVNPYDAYEFADSANGWNRIKYSNGDSFYGYVSADFSKVDSTVLSSHSITRLDNPSTSLLLFGIMGALFCAGFCIYMRRLDEKRLSMKIEYEMDDTIKEVHLKFLNYFLEGTRSSRIWQIIHRQGTSDWKRNGGAGTLVNRIGLRGIALDRKPAPFFKTNVPIPNIRLRGTDLYFFPERLVIKKNSQFASVFYKNLDVDGILSKFIEDESVPPDAQVVDQTWKYLNKNGTPDRRFSNNMKLPICQYHYYTFSSSTGVYETICTSKQGAFTNFSKFIKAIGDLQHKMNCN
jgi:hypothetical protein